MSILTAIIFVYFIVLFGWRLIKVFTNLHRHLPDWKPLSFIWS